MMAVCVDRHSGWIVATPHRMSGWTAKAVAECMISQSWTPWGVPSIITSDQGPQFAGQWWKTICASLGIRQAYSQAYHHRANGRAEAAGYQLLTRLRKIQTQERMCWVEALPAVLRCLHDTKGEAGLSPYEIVFGRERPLAGLPYTPPREAEDAVQFMQRQREFDQKVASIAALGKPVQFDSSA